MDTWNMVAINWLDEYASVLGVCLLVLITLLLALLANQAQSIIGYLSDIRSAVNNNNLTKIEQEVEKIRRDISSINHNTTERRRNKDDYDF